MPAFGQGLPEGAMQAIQEAIDRRRGGGVPVPAMSQVSTNAPATQAPPTAPVPVGAGAAMSIPQAGGTPMPQPIGPVSVGSGEAQIILKAMSKRLEQLPVGA